MKLSNGVRESTRESFKPIVVNLTIESEDELLELWHRLNVSIKGIADLANSKDMSLPLPFPVKTNTRGLFELIDMECVRYSLYSSKDCGCAICLERGN